MRFARLALALAVLLPLDIAEGQQPPPLAGVIRIQQDVEIAGALTRLIELASADTIAISNVSIVDPVAGAILPGRNVLIRNGVIEWTGPAAEAPAVRSATIVDGTGRFLSPGLADMHVHTLGMGEHLLRLAAGVTTVRDMDGFPWMLALRDSIASGRMAGATEYVAGTIIADRPLEGYAVVVRTPDAARAAVRDQAACGYAFVKVHNNLSLPLFDAVADEARRLGLDLVGHVPHDISLLHALRDGGMRTIEHLKGFLNDRNLLPSDEDYRPALAGADTWITPTFYTLIDRAHGEEVETRLNDPRMRFVPRTTRESWRGSAAEPGSTEAMLHDRFVATQREVVRRLLPLSPRWLAGTDTAGYRFNIAGFALHDEMAMMRDLGIPVTDVIRAATSEPARAMHEEGRFGRIVPGARADLVLLAGNPFADLDAYRSPLGVMARGRWYDRAALDSALALLVQSYGRPPTVRIGRRSARRLAGQVEAWRRQGLVFDSAALQMAARELQAAGHSAAAARLLASAVPETGPCRAERPL